MNQLRELEDSAAEGKDMCERMKGFEQDAITYKQQREELQHKLMKVRKRRRANWKCISFNLAT